MKGVSKKKLMEAKEPPAGSFLIHRKYGPVTRCHRHADLKRVLNSDMAALSGRLDWFGNPEDRQVFEELNAAVGLLIDSGEGELDMLADPHSGVRYQVRVTRVLEP